MNASSGPGFGVSADDLLRYDWQVRLAKHPRKDCRSYYEVFGPGIEEYENASDDLGRRVYSLLNAVASFRAVFHKKGNVFLPIWQDANGTRSIIPEDLADSDLEALGGIVNTIGDAEFRARVSDVIWECKKDFKLAQIAVDAYLESAELHKTAHLWPPYEERLARAVQLSRKLGSGKPYHQKAVAAVEAAVKEFEGNPKAGLLCHRLMLILLSQDVGDAAHYSVLSERVAKEMATRGEWDFSHAYWLIAARWFNKSKDEASSHRCVIEAAECWVSKADSEINSKKYGLHFASFWMGKGFEALRQASGDPNRIKEINLRFLDLQQKARTEIKSIDIDTEGLRENEEKTREAVKKTFVGQGFSDAIFKLVHITKPTQVDLLLKQMEEQSKSFIGDKIAGSIALDSSGKVADTLPPVGSEAPEDADAAQRKRATLLAQRTRWPIAAVWLIEPARITILEEHGIRLNDLAFLVIDNPFIPIGHEGIYLRGIQEGFFGDWLVAMHLLIPQVEASIRHVLQQHQVVTSTLDSDRTQKERDLNQLLWMPELEQIFDKNTLFDLRGILIERFGHNMRNELAHGLMAEGAFYQPGAVYLWWLILRLCWYGDRYAPKPKEVTKS